MKKLIILSILSVFAVGCADNLDTVPEPVVPNVTVDLADAKSETEESIIIKPRRPRTKTTTTAKSGT
ncbi:MAG: hypothetical protein ACJAS3_000444 [Roseivirga sp.]|jgi:hypothetical protein